MKKLGLLAASLAAVLVGAVGSNAASTVSLPCGSSLAATYASAPSSGAVYELGACAYTGGTFQYKASQTGVVEFVGVQGTTMGGLTIRGAKHVTIRGPIRMGAIFATAQNGSDANEGALAENWTFDGVDMHGGGIFVRGAKDFRFLNGQSGDTVNSAYSQTIGAYQSQPPSENILIENWRFHDMDRASGDHMECLFVQESRNVVIRNSHFDGCDVMSLYVNAIIGGQVAGMVVEGTRFDPVGAGDSETGGNGFYTADSGAWPVVYRNNSFGQSIVAGGASGCGNTRDSSSNTVPAALLQPCAGTPPPAPKQCADSQDNDADGKVDLADPGCADASDDSESPDPTPPPPPPAGCDQACEQAYQAQIAALQADKAQLEAQVADLSEDLDAAEAALEAEKQHSAELQAKIDAARAALG